MKIYYPDDFGFAGTAYGTINNATGESYVLSHDDWDGQLVPVVREGAPFTVTASDTDVKSFQEGLPVASECFSWTGSLASRRAGLVEDELLGQKHVAVYGDHVLAAEIGNSLLRTGIGCVKFIHTSEERVKELRYINPKAEVSTAPHIPDDADLLIATEPLPVDYSVAMPVISVGVHACKLGYDPAILQDVLGQAASPVDIAQAASYAVRFALDCLQKGVPQYVPMMGTYNAIEFAAKLKRLPHGKKIVMVGAGSMGSEVLKLLAGFPGLVRDVILIDDDILAPHNLSRHVLDARSLGAYKVHALAERFQSQNLHIIPYACELEDVDYDLFADADLILCTADSERCNAEACRVAKRLNIPFLSALVFERAFAGVLFWADGSEATVSYYDVFRGKVDQETARRHEALYMVNPDTADAHIQPGLQSAILCAAAFGTEAAINMLSNGKLLREDGSVMAQSLGKVIYTDPRLCGSAMFVRRRPGDVVTIKWE